MYFSDVLSELLHSKEHGGNGNGTPPGTPKRSQSPRGGHISPKPMSRSSSPVPIPRKFLRNFLQKHKNLQLVAKKWIIMFF